jgi:hypothetical protein
MKDKFEARNTKFETNLKFLISNDQKFSNFDVVSYFDILISDLNNIF